MLKDRLSTKIDWLIANTADGWWVGYSPALKITAQGTTREELQETISETQKLLFKQLVKSGQLDTFLAVHDWEPEIGLMEQVDEKRLAESAC